ncbi:hypothetical protein CFII64_04945 [Pseudomonas sp. CFII64]|nr:hypothetical protein CFII64_04945 [Pseudomonas sp. CFII64]
MFMRAEAAVFMIVIVLISRLSDGERQQGERQSKKQTAHKTVSGTHLDKIVM